MKLDPIITKNALIDAVRQSLEGIAFLDVDLLDEELDSTPGIIYYFSEITILRPVKLKIIFAVPQDCARKWVETLYVENSVDINDNVILDVLAESLNTSAGCFMKNILADSQSYELGIPKKWKNNEPLVGDNYCKCVLRVLDEKMGVFIIKSAKSKKK